MTNGQTTPASTKKAAERSTEHAQLLGKRSMETLKAALAEVAKGNAGGALARGRIFELVGYFPEAASSYGDALAVDSESDECTARLAIALLKAGDGKGGLATAMKLAARNPEYRIKALATEEVSSAMTILGDALIGNDRIADAIEAFEAARKIDASDTYASGRLAKAYLATNQPDKAIGLAKDLSSNPRFRSLGTVLALGETSRALLPKFGADAFASAARLSDHGRPLLIGPAARVAPLTTDSVGWAE
jgi:tetratricopeptide (TPR) repeat protein